MKQSEEMSMFDALNDRLDDFFDDEGGNAPSSESGPVPEASGAGSDGASGEPGNGSGLDRLKAIVLEMEWEISDENLDGFLFEVENLAPMGEVDRVVALFLKLLDSMGRYLKVKKASANPDYILFFKNLFASFCRVVEDGGLSTRERNVLLLEEVENFKAFKSRVVTGQPLSSADVGKTSPAAGDGYPNLSEEIKRYIRETIRAELSARMG